MHAIIIEKKLPLRLYYIDKGETNYDSKTRIDYIKIQNLKLMVVKLYCV